MEGFATGKVGKHTGISSVRGGAESSEARFEKLYLENFGYVYGYVRSRMSSEDQSRMTVSIKADRDVPMGMISDIKRALQQDYALRINYSATEKKNLSP